MANALKQLYEAIEVQRWDDHRYYHQSRINQSLHFVSALSFLAAYALLFVDPVMAALIAWLVAMTTRQAGHFFFESKDYDVINQATHEYKEAIKVGYNLNRKVVLLSVWAAIPVFAFVWPPAITWAVPELFEDSALRMIGMAWLFLGVAGQTHCLHHRLGTRHMKRHLVHAGDVDQFAHHLPNCRMVAPQKWTQGFGLCHGLINCLFVKIQPKKIHAIAATDINKALPIQISQPGTLTLLPNVANREPVQACITKLKRNPISLGQLNFRWGRCITPT